MLIFHSQHFVSIDNPSSNSSLVIVKEQDFFMPVCTIYTYIFVYTRMRSSILWFMHSQPMLTQEGANYSFPRRIWLMFDSCNIM